MKKITGNTIQILTCILRWILFCKWKRQSDIVVVVNLSANSFLADLWKSIIINFGFHDGHISDNLSIRRWYVCCFLFGNNTSIYNMHSMHRVGKISKVLPKWFHWLRDKDENRLTLNATSTNNCSPLSRSCNCSDDENTYNK